MDDGMSKLIRIYCECFPANEPLHVTNDIGV